MIWVMINRTAKIKVMKKNKKLMINLKANLANKIVSNKLLKHKNWRNPSKNKLKRAKSTKRKQN